MAPIGRPLLTPPADASRSGGGVCTEGGKGGGRFVRVPASRPVAPSTSRRAPPSVVGPFTPRDVGSRTTAVRTAQPPPPRCRSFLSRSWSRGAPPGTGEGEVGASRRAAPNPSIPSRTCVWKEWGWSVAGQEAGAGGNCPSSTHEYTTPTRGSSNNVAETPRWVQDRAATQWPMNGRRSARSPHDQHEDLGLGEPRRAKALQ